jgi:hypothetical protein
MRRLKKPKRGNATFGQRDYLHGAGVEDLEQLRDMLGALAAAFKDADPVTVPPFRRCLPSRLTRSGRTTQAASC